MSRLTNLSPTSAASQLTTRIATSVILATALCLPAFIRMFAMGQVDQVSDVAAVGLGLPVLAIGLGHATRGPVAGRLILLILWYAYLNIGAPVSG